MDPSPAVPIRIAISTPQGSRSIDYDGGKPLRIGRDAAVDLVLDVKNVSRAHCEIRPAEDEPGSFLLVDLGSRNGTFLNGSRLGDPAPLHPGDVITVGAARITFGEAAPPEPADLPLSPDTATAEELEVPEEEAPPIPPSPEEPASPPLAPSRVRGTPRPAARRVLVPALGGLAVLLLTAVIAVAIRSSRTAPAPGPTADRGAAAPAPAAGEESSGRAEVATPPPDSTPGDSQEAAAAGILPPHGSGADEEEWRRLHRERSGRELLTAYWDFAARHPDSPHAEEARAVLEAFQELGPAGGHGFLDKVMASARALCDEERLGDARALLAAGSRLARTEGSGEVASLLEEELARVDGLIEELVSRRQQEASTALAEGRSAAAFHSLASLAPRVGAPPAFAEALLEFEKAFGAADLAREPPGSSRALEHVSRARVAFGACRFREAQGEYLLALTADRDLGSEDKALYWRKADEAAMVARMFESALALLGETHSEVEIFPSETVRVTAATAEEIEYEVSVEGGAKGKVKLRWEQLRDPTKLRFFSAVGLGGEALLGLATYAWEVGDEAAAEAALLRAQKQGNRWNDQVQALLSLRWEVPVPEGGFVVYEGHFVDPVERERREVEKRKAKDRAEAAKRELAEARRNQRLDRFLVIAQELRGGGHFEAADGLYRAIADRLKKEAVGREAARRLEDPVLLVTRISEGDPPSPTNRLTFFFLGDGYQTRDDQQTTFSGAARRVWSLLLKDEPYREYASYLDARFVNISSAETGSDRVPGNVKRDTALGGHVDWDTYAVDGAAVGRILDRIAPGVRRQAVVVGNAMAASATGGGGLASLPKTSLGAVAHEVGHALGGLHDEYDMPAGNDPQRKIVHKRQGNVPVQPRPPNLIAGSNREEVLKAAPWRAWIEAGKDPHWTRGRVDIFEGGGYSPVEVWRPQANCMMRYGGMFCVACMEQMVKSLYRNVRPIDEVRPDRKRIDHTPGAPLVLELVVLKPRTHFLEVKWDFLYTPPPKPPAPEPEPTTKPTGPTRVVPTPKPTPTLTHKLRGEEYRRIAPGGRVVEGFRAAGEEMRDPGTYRFSVVVRDPTPWVLKDDEGLLRQTWEWTVVVPEDSSRRRPATAAGK